MFKLVTNFDHWHTLYESKDCSRGFRAAPIGGGGEQSFPSSILVSSPEGIGERQFVVILVADSPEVLWSLEAIFRTRLGGDLDDVLSRDGEAHRRAMAKLMKVAESLDDHQPASGREVRGNLNSGSMPLVGAGLAGFVLGIGMSYILGFGEEDHVAETSATQALEAMQKIGTEVKESGAKVLEEVKGSGAKVLQEVQGIGTEAKESGAKVLQEVKGIGTEVKGSGAEVLKEVKLVRDDVNAGVQRLSDSVDEKVEGIRTEVSGGAVKVSEAVNGMAGKVAEVARTAKEIRDKVNGIAVGPGEGQDDSLPAVPPEDGEAAATERASDTAEGDSEPTPVPSPGVDPRAAGYEEQVRRLQEYLIGKEYEVRGGADGVLGDSTREAFLKWAENSGKNCPGPDILSMEGEDILKCASDLGLLGDPRRSDPGPGGGSDLGSTGR